LIFKYRPEVFDAIAVTIIENGKEIANKLLYSAIKSRLGFKLSNRDYKSHLFNLEKDGFVSRERKRRNIRYGLTVMAMSAHKLNILGCDSNKERLCRLYQFLFLASCLHRAKRISDTELDKLLHFYGTRREKLVKESCIYTSDSNLSETVYAPISSLTISKIQLNEGERNSTFNYCFQEEPFSVNDLRFFLISGLRSYPIFVADLPYVQSELLDAVSSLSENEILGLASSYNSDETKYSVRGDFLQKLREIIWENHSLEMYYLSLSGSCRELTGQEKEGLKFLFGKIEGYKIIKFSKRMRAIQKKPRARELDELRHTIDAIIDTKVKLIYQNYRTLVNENYLFHDLLEKILIRKHNVTSTGKYLESP